MLKVRTTTSSHNIPPIELVTRVSRVRGIVAPVDSSHSGFALPFLTFGPQSSPTESGTSLPISAEGKKPSQPSTCKPTGLLAHSSFQGDERRRECDEEFQPSHSDILFHGMEGAWNAGAADAATLRRPI